MKAILVLLAAYAFVAWNDAQAACQIGGMVDYWSDMTALAHEKWAAYGTADYIAGRLQATGMRRPDPGVAYEAAREFIARECRQ